MPYYKYRMNNIYHQRLTLPVEFKVNESNDPAMISFYDDQHPELEKFLLSIGVAIRDCQRFYIQPGGILPPHADCDHVNNYTKLNYVYQGKDSIMKWYRLNPDVVLVPGLTMANNKYLSVPLKDLTVVHTATVGFPSLVNSGQFHAVMNGSTEPRICYSFVLRYAENPDRNLDWNDAIVRFKDYLDLSFADGV